MKPRKPCGRAREPECAGGRAAENLHDARAGGSWLGAGGDEKQRRARGRSGAGGRGLCLLRGRPHAPAAPRRPGRAQPVTQLAMAEPASGAGGAALDGERGKRPPPEGEPAAPASGVLGMCATARTRGATGGAIELASGLIRPGPARDPLVLGAAETCGGQGSRPGPARPSGTGHPGCRIATGREAPPLRGAPKSRWSEFEPRLGCVTLGA